MPIARHLLTLFFAITVSFAACLNHSLAAQELSYDKQFKEAFGKQLPDLYAPTAPVSMSYKASDGKQLKYELLTDSEMDTMGMVTPRKDEYLIGITLDKGDGEKIKATSDILEMVSEMSTRGGGIRIDTKDPSTEKADTPFIPLKKIWQSVVDSESHFEMSADGIIPEFEPPKSIAETIEQQGAAYGITARDVSATYLTGIVQLPKKPVSVGDQWDMQVVVSPLGTSDASIEATFLGMGVIDGKPYAVLLTEFEATLEDGDGPITEAEVGSVSIILFDVDAGNMFKQFTIAEADMVLQIGDNELQQTSAGNSVIKRIDD